MVPQHLSTAEPRSDSLIRTSGKCACEPFCADRDAEIRPRRRCGRISARLNIAAPALQRRSISVARRSASSASASCRSASGRVSSRADRCPPGLATAAVAIPLLLWLIFGAPFVIYRGVVLLFTLVALVEYFHMAFPTRSALQRLGIVSGALVALAMAGDPTESAVGMAAGLMAVVTFGFMSCLISSKDPAGAVNDLGHMVLGVLYAGAFLPHFIWLRVNPESSGPSWVTFVLAVAMGGDSGALWWQAFGKYLMAVVQLTTRQHGVAGIGRRPSSESYLPSVPA
jgi:hypothetical protein